MGRCEAPRALPQAEPQPHHTGAGSSGQAEREEKLKDETQPDKGIFSCTLVQIPTGKTRAS